MKRLFCLAAVAASILGYGTMAQAAGVEFSIGQTGVGTQTYRLGLQSDWDKSWLQSDSGRLTGFWNGAYTYWKGDKSPDNHSLSFAPVFVYEFSGASTKPYIEAAIGAAWLTRHEVEDRRQGSSLTFEDRIGVGLRFAGGSEVGFRVFHYSNAGLSSPNEGFESYALHYTMPL